MKRLRSFWRKEDANASIEFVILFPAFIGIFLSAFESGLMMTRNVMMERGVDLAVRELRLGTPTPPTFEEFKQSICDNAVIIKDCDGVIQVELQPVSTTTWGPLDTGARCRDVTSDIDPIDQTEYSVGTNNELMMVRVCALFRPLSPGTTLGLRMPDVSEGLYALITTSAFVNEPSR